MVVIQIALKRTRARAQAWLTIRLPVNAMTSPIPLSTVTRVSTISTYHSLLPVLFFRLSWQATFLQGRKPLIVLSRLCASQYVGLILRKVGLKYNRHVLLACLFHFFCVLPCVSVSLGGDRNLLLQRKKAVYVPHLLSKLSNQVMNRTKTAATRRRIVVFFIVSPCILIHWILHTN